jgi:GMP synthase-like glutamine amidotransferase
VIRAAGAAQARGRSAVLLARATFAALVVAGVAALFIAQALKREAPLIKSHSHSMAFPGPGHEFAHFHLTATLGGYVEVSVLTQNGERTVKVLAAHLRIHEYRQFPALEWDGTNATGRPAPAGAYVVEVRFENYGRSVIVPNFVLTYRGKAA